MTIIEYAAYFYSMVRYSNTRSSTELKRIKMFVKCITSYYQLVMTQLVVSSVSF